MNRLTYKDSTVPHTNTKGELWEAYSDANYNEVINKLAAYEDTGYSPLEIKSLEGEWNATRKVVDSYRAAEKQGLLVRLPCKVGDTVYVVKNIISRGYPDPIITKQIFEESFSYEHLNFPKAVYLTYEEAEAALKEEET